MEKQQTLAMVLIGLIFVVWLYINSPEPQPQTPNQADSTLVDTQKQPVPAEPKHVEQTETPKVTVPTILDSSVVSAPERIINIENDLVKLELTTKGAKVKRYFIKKYKTWYSKDLGEDAPYYKTMVQLVNTRFEGGDLNQTFITKKGEKIETSALNFNVDKSGYSYKLTGEDSLSITFSVSFGENSSITKTYTFRGDNYQSKVNFGFNNMQNIVAGSSYDVSWEHGINFVEKNSVDEANYSNASLYAGEEHLKVNASDVDEKEKKDVGGIVDWMSVKSKYFAVLLSPDNPNSEWHSYIVGTKTKDNVVGDREYYSLTYSVPFTGMKKQNTEFSLFIGPVDYEVLAAYDKSYEAIYDFGSFMGLSFIIRPISEYVLLPLFKFLHSFIPNYGVVILLVAFLVKMLLYPLTKQSYKSMKKMQLLQPKMKEIKEKFKDDPQKQQQETMKLYKVYGINPMGGCLPMFAQMPILIALFYLFNVAIDLRNQPFVLWIDNLAAPDVIAELPFRLPIFGVSAISGLAITLGVVMFIQQSMTAKDPSQKALVYIMPVMLTVLFMSFPSGVNLYYLMFNLLTIIQQWMINKSKDGAELVPLDPKDQKPGFFSKLMQQAEETRKVQQKQQNKKRR